MKKEYADFLLKKTKEDYDTIADSFSLTRDRLWEEFSIFQSYIKEGDSILDLGCGNGRLLEFFSDKNIDYVGVDNSEKLIERAIDKFSKSSIKPKFVVADALKLPFKDESFDKVFSVAVLHHIPSSEYRRRFFEEARRVLKPGGILILTVWNLRGFTKKNRVIFKYALLKIFGKSKFDFGDIFVPWQNKILRYIHCFTKKELIDLAEGVGFKTMEKGILKRKKTKNSNIFLIAKKRAQ